MTLEQKYLRSFVQCLLVAVVMVSVMPVLSPFMGTALGAPGVTIPDDNLRTALDKQFGKGKGAPITETELDDILQLHASGMSITDLTGLEYCSNLEVLNLRSNSISDISALAELNKVERLWLNYNGISDISTVVGLKNLKHCICTATASATYRP